MSNDRTTVIMLKATILSSHSTRTEPPGRGVDPPSPHPHTHPSVSLSDLFTGAHFVAPHKLPLLGPDKRRRRVGLLTSASSSYDKHLDFLWTCILRASGRWWPVTPSGLWALRRMVAVCMAWRRVVRQNAVSKSCRGSKRAARDRALRSSSLPPLDPPDPSPCYSMASEPSVWFFFWRCGVARSPLLTLTLKKKF